MASRATAPSQSKPEVESPERKQVAEEPTPTQVTLDPSKIATVAYALWVASGRQHGADQEDWFDAEFALRSALEEERKSTPK